MKFSGKTLRIIFVVIAALVLAKVGTTAFALFELRGAVDEVQMLFAASNGEALPSAVARVGQAATRAVSELQPIAGVIGMAMGESCAVNALVNAAAELSPLLEELAPLSASVTDLTTQAGENSIRVEGFAQRWGDIALDADSVAALQRLHQRTICEGSRFQPYLDAVNGASAALDTTLRIPRDHVLQDGSRWLIVLNNTDELRATGGFTTALIVVSIEDGVLSWRALNSYGVDDRALLRYHPPPPLPMLRYMGLEFWMFRDANWSPDRPTAALRALQLFALDQHVAPPNGLVTVNMSALATLARHLPPLQVGGEPFDANTALDRIRDGWNVDFDIEYTADDRKDFIVDFAADFAQALQTQTGPTDLLRAGMALDEMLARRDVMIYAADPDLAALLVAQGWNGAVHSVAGDYLFVVDTNLGYNKVAPRIAETITYAVELTGAPTARLSLNYHNTNSPVVGCTVPHDAAVEMTYHHRMTGCYWDYIRVFTAGADIQDYHAYATPAEWFVVTQIAERAKIDAQMEAGREGFATMLVVPPDETREVWFEYNLPPEVIVEQEGVQRYRLYVQRQAGAPDHPLEIRIMLPAGAEIMRTEPSNAVVEGQIVIFQNTLIHDQTFVVEYRP